MTGDREVEDTGFALRRQALSSSRLAELLSLVLPGDEWPSQRPLPHALRNVLWDRGELAGTLTCLGVDDIASEGLGRPAFAINAIYFDKTSRANWKVPCHQDLIMPVEAQADEAGFAGWTVKAGVPHVEPPTDVLAGLAAERQVVGQTKNVDMETVRWGVAGVLLIVAGIVVLGNWSIVFGRIVLHRERTPSWIPLVGGSLAALAGRAAPLHAVQKFWWI